MMLRAVAGLKLESCQRMCVWLSADKWMASGIMVAEANITIPGVQGARLRFRRICHVLLDTHELLCCLSTFECSLEVLVWRMGLQRAESMYRGRGKHTVT